MTRKAKAKSKRNAKLPAGVVARVSVERGSGRIEFDNVPPNIAPALLAQALIELRELAKEHPELIPDLGSMGSYHPVDVIDDDWADEGKTRPRRKLGF